MGHKTNDLTGQRFGKLVVIERDTTKNNPHVYWICQCDCGNICSKRGYMLRNGQTTDCGCEHKKRQRNNIDITSEIGKQYGYLTVLARDMSKEIGHGKDSFWICQCQCGNKISVRKTELHRGHTQSCGCLRAELVTQKNTLDLTGQRFGKLIALENTYQLTPHHSYIWKCRCDCGNIKLIPAEYLQSGKVNSCGCLTQSIGELRIKTILQQNNINFIEQFTSNDLRSPITNYPLRFDFAILNNANIVRLIEFDGEQHFQETDFFETPLEQVQQYDQIKNQWAQQNNIPLVRIPYTERDNLSLDLLLSDQYLI